MYVNEWCGETQSGDPCVQSQAFKLSPATGECWPNSRTEILITFTPPRALRYSPHIVTWFMLFQNYKSFNLVVNSLIQPIKLQSYIEILKTRPEVNHKLKIWMFPNYSNYGGGDVHSRYYCKAYCTISGKSERLELQLEGTGVGPLTQFVPAKLDLQELCLFQYYDYEVQLQNKGDLEVRVSWRNFILLQRQFAVNQALNCSRPFKSFSKAHVWLRSFTLQNWGFRHRLNS